MKRYSDTDKWAGSDKLADRPAMGRTANSLSWLCFIPSLGFTELGSRYVAGTFLHSQSAVTNSMQPGGWSTLFSVDLYNFNR